MPHAKLPRPRLEQLAMVVEQLRDQVAHMAACDSATLRLTQATEILEELCEVEHLLAIHQAHLERTLVD